MPKNNLIWQLNGGHKMASPFVQKKTIVVFFTRKYNFHKKVLPMVNKIKMGGGGLKLNPLTT